MRLRTIASFLLALGALLTLAGGCSRYRRYQNQKARQAARDQPARLYAPQPAKDRGAYLVGADGIDADGAPLRHVDRVQLRGMLARKEYGKLTQIFEELQSKFEATPANEAWPMDAAEAFESGETTLDADLDAWVTATPESFAPYLARGVHQTMVGYAQRGPYWGQSTTPAALAAMKTSYDRATIDLQKAIALRPRAQEAFRQLVRIGGHTGDRLALEKANADAATACPSCFRVRTMYMTMQMPRWGGSYDAMTAYAAKTATAGPKTKYLAGYADLDRARSLGSAKSYDRALPVIARACAIGEYWEFLLERAEIERGSGDADAAMTDVRRANELRPGHPDILAELADEEADARQWEAAGTDLLEVLRLNPTNFTAAASAGFIFDGLLEHAELALKDGDAAVAARESALVSELGPDDPRARKLRSAVVLAGGDSVGDLRSAAERDPGSFEAVQKLDYTLEKSSQYDEIIALWTTYLARHPDDGRAYLERGGAYYNSHHLPEATADANKSCALGVSEGCLRAKQLAHGMH